MTKKFNNRFNWRIIKHSLIFVFLSMILVFVSTAATCLAQPTGGNWWSTVQNGGLNQVGQAYGGGDPKDVRIITANIINVILGFLGIIAVVLILYAGFKWLTAGGNEENIETAKKILTAGAIGLAIILASWGVVTFVLPALLNATGVK